MRGLEVRRAALDDYLSINSHQQALFGLHRPSQEGEITEYEGYPHVDFAAEIDCADKIWLIATVAGQVCGSAFAYITADRFGAVFCYLDSMYVDPGFRRAGVGRCLLENIIDFARVNGTRSIQLDVLGSNVSAERFYRELGFCTKMFTLEKELD